MKKNVYDFLVKVPVVGRIAEAVLDPVISSKRAYALFFKYRADNPNVKITKRVSRQLFLKNKK